MHHAKKYTGLKKKKKKAVCAKRCSFIFCRDKGAKFLYFSYRICKDVGGRRKWRKGAERSKDPALRQAQAHAKVATALTDRQVDSLFELMLMGRPHRIVS
jgi:hypothetical protein